MKEILFFENLPYHATAFEGNAKNLETITGQDINEADQRGLTALHVAILSGNTDCALLLIEKGIDVNILTVVALSSFDKQYRDRVRPIFMTYNVTEWELIMPFDAKVTALHLACAMGQENVVVSLLQHKAKAAARSNGGASPMHYAALHGHDSIVSLLLENKAKPDAKIKSQSVPGWFDADMTVLHAAAESGNCQLIQRLLDAGAGFNDLTKGSCGVIFFASRSRNAKAVELVLSLGAAIEVADPHYYNNPFEESMLREDAATTAVLIKNLPQVNGVTIKENGRDVHPWMPPIYRAIQYQNHEIIQLLTEAGAKLPDYEDIDRVMFCGDLQELKKRFEKGEKPSEIGSYGFSRLFEAVGDGHYEMVAFLLENGYDKYLSRHEPNSYSFTPLHKAAMSITRSTNPLEDVLFKRRSVKIAELLLQQGAEPNALDSFGRSPLDIAFKEGNDAMVAAMSQYGCRQVKSGN